MSSRLYHGGCLEETVFHILNKKEKKGRFVRPSSGYERMADEARCARQMNIYGERVSFLSSPVRRLGPPRAGTKEYIIISGDTLSGGIATARRWRFPKMRERIAAVFHQSSRPSTTRHLIFLSARDVGSLRWWHEKANWCHRTRASGPLTTLSPPSSPCVVGHMTGKNLSTTERLFLHLLFLSLFLLLLLFHYFSLLILPLSLWSLKSGTRTAWRGSPVPVAPTNSVPTEVSSRLGISQHRPRRKIFHKYEDNRGKREENKERISLREDQTWNKDFQTLDCILRLKASSRRLSGPRLDRINR